MIRYETKIEAFEGPLDLLLHLIKEAKVDIHEVKISEITEQYLTYIKAMKDLHLDVASEYLVMAANLMLIKSKKLLPKEDAEFDDEYEEDPEAELIRRLLEYQMYKDSLDDFRELEAARGQFYTKPAIDFSEYIDEHLRLDVTYDTSELILAFEKLIRRKQLETPIPTTIVAEKVTVADRMAAIKEALNFKQRINFLAIFERFDKEYVVVTFLAMLELAKTGEIRLLQNASEDDIEVVAKGWF
ncbi:MAG: segregation/condensation protein A [Turicibacter sp.]|nr:segregation/condensation protein A [Turicibacter sp.]